MDGQKKLIDAAAIGVEVSWSFGNGDASAVKVPRVDVVRKLMAQNIDPDYLPEKDPTDALKHAVRIAPKGRGIIVKEMERKRRDTPLAFGVYVKRSNEGEGGDDWLCGARVRVEAVSVAAGPPEGSTGIECCEKVAGRIADDANELLETAYNKDLSNTLLAVGRRMNWISRRRNKGGVYFLLSGHDDRAERFVRLLKALEDLTTLEPYRNRFIPQITEVYPKPLSNATWTAAAAGTFDDEVERLLKDLDSMEKDGKMRDKTIEKRADECDELIRRAEEYRLFLADKVDELGTKLAGIRDRFLGALDQAADEAKSEFDKVDELTKVESKKAEQPGSQVVKGRKVVERPFDESMFDVEV